ncbi:MAG: ABC transporter substrate-binding protein [Thermodesulfobacteriota bacterium]
MKTGFYNLLLLLGLALCLQSPAPAGAQDFSLQGNRIVDQSGHEVRVERPFQRIISLYGAHTENLFFLGLDREVVGVGRNDRYPAEARQKARFSYHDGPERFLAATPDLVLVRPMISRGYPELMQRLRKSGIEVLSLQPGTVQEMYTYWKILGLLTGKEAKALDMIERFKSAVGRYEALTASITDKKKVYFEAIHSRMKTFSPGAMPLFVLKTAGGINVAQDARPSRGTNIAVYGKERILARASEIEIYLAQAGPMNSVSKEDIRQEPGFHLIEAVREDRIFLVDEKLVSRPTFRLLQGIQLLGRIMYPQLFQTQGRAILEQAGGRPG